LGSPCRTSGRRSGGPSVKAGRLMSIKSSILCNLPSAHRRSDVRGRTITSRSRHRY
jgi:hypothetical protein